MLAAERERARELRRQFDRVVTWQVAPEVPRLIPIIHSLQEELVRYRSEYQRLNPAVADMQKARKPRIEAELSNAQWMVTTSLIEMKTTHSD